jgi:hypothetical protein
VGFEIQFDVPHNDKIYQDLWKVTDVVPGPKGRVQLEIRRPFRRFGRELRAVRRRRKDPLAPDSRGLERFAPETNPDFARGNFLAGWTALTDLLKDFLEFA